MTVKILAFSGSARHDSLNQKLVTAAANGAKKAGADITVINLKDYPLPIYDGDFETANGLPDNAKKLKKLLAEHHGFLIATPEHNSSYSALLKNTIDWVSRAETKDEKPHAPYAGKYAVIMATSPGAMGGLRGLFALRELLQNINITVLAKMQAVGNGMNVFGADGQVSDEKQKAQIESLGAELATLLQKTQA